VQNQREKKSKAQRANEACRSFSFISPVQNKWATDGTCAFAAAELPVQCEQLYT
jgi:hypothetical protein